MDKQAVIDNLTEAIKMSPDDHTLYSARSTAYMAVEKVMNAMEDAEKCISLKPEWDIGYQKKATALHWLGNYDEAIKIYNCGLKLN
jgi:stress-induced-phosphoprotein 1